MAYNKKYNKKSNKKFVSILDVLDQLKKDYPGYIFKEAFGTLDPHNLTKGDVGKHASVAFSITDMPQILLNKKFEGKNPSKPFIDANNHCQKVYKDVIPKGAFVTGELMGIQKYEYTKSDGVYVVLHGSIVAKGVNDLSYDNLELLCESFRHEGYVVVCSDGGRFKLKREYFPHKSIEGQQIGKFKEGICVDDFTECGLKLCGDGLFGYHHAVVNNVNESVIAQKNGFQLVALPYDVVIGKQLENVFDGEKMFGLLENVGAGNKYRYNGNFNSSVDLASVVEFQFKFDGETVLLHCDDNGVLHLLIKFQVDVCEVNGGFKLGWYQ